MWKRKQQILEQPTTPILRCGDRHDGHIRAFCNSFHNFGLPENQKLDAGELTEINWNSYKLIVLFLPLKVHRPINLSRRFWCWKTLEYFFEWWHQCRLFERSIIVEMSISLNDERSVDRSHLFSRWSQSGLKTFSTCRCFHKQSICLQGHSLFQRR